MYTITLIRVYGFIHEDQGSLVVTKFFGTKREAERFIRRKNKELGINNVSLSLDFGFIRSKTPIEWVRNNQKNLEEQMK